ncbi:hypothetical protein TVAG_195910 [Trichomonas vaginalis G3]|uniref:Uncharacterized protein n=1 Tax=Trichomonas vaginalis (strain ATCC PRA-98 / G3) TaxID=412133 RepID=A2ETN0_TRIV3|nr:hypothetical protein TVAGG3_0404140 [Trichomonas vaginalis G3]EAY03998.1 hypothetical protein TVAG_195910 [Trichomonas vaginalis G3]KAI5534912.1 hypothetical protein TVAGG3_0404140 [Trichomonas vaginalis G3]|eukprot:XP_001316221.1 hypothetical protein [Trichomonas vaginalis G3]
MGENVEELKAKLLQLRQENRAINMQNILLQNQLNETTEAMNSLLKTKSHEERGFDVLRKNLEKELETEGNQQTKIRMERRKMIMLEIHKYTEENRVLTTEIKDLKAEVEHAKLLHKSYTAKNNAKTTKKKSKGPSPDKGKATVNVTIAPKKN